MMSSPSQRSSRACTQPSPRCPRCHGTSWTIKPRAGRATSDRRPTTSRDILDAFLVRVDGDTDKLPRQRRRRLFSKIGLGKVMARHEIATMIADIRKKLEEMDKRHNRYRVDHLVAAVPAAAPTDVDLRISALLKKASDLVGIDEPRDAVIDMLSLGSSSKKVKIVCIVGSGGLGKTTLAKAGYDKIKLQFDCQAFVSVGQNPDPTKVLREIFVDLKKNETEKTVVGHDDNTIIDHDYKRYPTGADTMGLSPNELIKRICEFLDGKRYISFIFIQIIGTSLLLACSTPKHMLAILRMTIKYRYLS
ncbi:hypothetical protein HU200_053917 [Digitaria exilis]|uniref:NB-ARC domain-containing protein n=1 Tax=Digitaria exilis TaxID=1010633 RepID=A0A835AVV6_9POAL|nr:hypothetical protein HU200_053917 [Digitaria exilis]